MSDALTARFSFTKLVVPDLEAAAAFYRAVFGYGEGQVVRSTIAGRPMEEIIFPRTEGEAGLILLQYLEGPEPSPSGVIAGYRTSDLDAFQARVLAAGGAVVQPIAPLASVPHMRFAFFADPAGYVIEVLEPLG
jgi:predicted enzyme related to lactoylglutathione lyase